MSSLKRLLYIFLGTLFLLLGALGVFLPVLPTTPFWLLTCWFYIRSSERLYNRVMANKYFGSYIKAYMVDKSIPLQKKVIILLVLWISILVSIYIVEPCWVQLLLLAVGIGVSWHILSFPTRRVN